MKLRDIGKSGKKDEYRGLNFPSMDEKAARAMGRSFTGIGDISGGIYAEKSNLSERVTKSRTLFDRKAKKKRMKTGDWTEYYANRKPPAMPVVTEYIGV